MCLKLSSFHRHLRNGKSSCFNRAYQKCYQKLFDNWEKSIWLQISKLRTANSAFSNLNIDAAYFKISSQIFEILVLNVENRATVKPNFSCQNIYKITRLYEKVAQKGSGFWFTLNFILHNRAARKILFCI